MPEVPMSSLLPTHATHAGTHAGTQVHHLPVTGALSPFVNALLAVDLASGGPLPLAIAPHDSLVLSVQMARGPDAAFARAERGLNTHLTGIREHTGSFIGAGDCVTLFALLTPLGAVQLLESQPLAPLPRIRARMAELLDHRLTGELEAAVAQAEGLEEKLARFAAWLETRATAQRAHTRAAVRAGRAAMRLCAAPNTAMDTLAGEQHVSRRQLERDFAHWVGTSPRHLSQVARVQAVSRKARAGASLADVAAEVGFADQSHMSRVVRQLVGMPPKAFVRSQRAPLALAFRRATGGGTVYL
jgi:AraC-like DNA-binding protein